MNRIVIQSEIGADGVLHLAVPVGLGDANQKVSITIEPLPRPRPMSQKEHAEFIESIAGSWDGEWVEPEDPPPQERDPL